MLKSVSTIDRSAEREEIEQVRVLLFGDIQKENERRIAALEEQLRELRQTMERQLSAQAEAHAASQAEFIRTLGEAIAQLGNRVSTLAGQAKDAAPHHE